MPATPLSPSERTQMTERSETGRGAGWLCATIAALAFLFVTGCYYYGPYYDPGYAYRYGYGYRDNGHHGHGHHRGYRGRNHY